MIPAGRNTPTLAVLITGGIGVLVVIAFVGAIALARDGEPGPGDRVEVIESEGVFFALAARCPDERVRAVEVRQPDGPTLWRIVSDKGTIDRSFEIGGQPPTFFATDVPLQSTLSGTLEVEVAIDDVVDRERFDPAALERAELSLSCDGTGLGLVPLAFVIGGVGVIVAYGTMVRRFLQAR